MSYVFDCYSFFNLKIIYTTVTSYLTSSSQYLDVALNSIATAKALYGAGSNEAKKVHNAWFAVGVLDTAVTTGINELSFDNVYTIAPNPAQQFLQLHAAKQLDNTNVSVLNMLGQTVIEEHVDGIQILSLDVCEIPVGTYVIKVSNEQGRMCKMFIKK